MEQQERTIIEIGEPRIDILPTETTDFFYTALLSRITEFIHNDKAEKEQPQNDNKGV